MLPLPPLPEPVPELRWARLSQESLVIEADHLDRHGVGMASAHNRSSSGYPSTCWSRTWVPSRQGQLDGLVSASADDIHQSSLGDEVALEVADWLLGVGVSLRRNGTVLKVTLPTAKLQKLHLGKDDTAQRVVLELDAPLLVQRRGDDLVLDLRLNPAQFNTLSRLGLQPQLRPRGVALRGQATRLSTLSLTGPWRLVLEGLQPEPSATATAQTLHSPAVASWLRRGLVLEQRRVKVGSNLWRWCGPAAT